MREGIRTDFSMLLVAMVEAAATACNAQRAIYDLNCCACRHSAAGVCGAPGFSRLGRGSVPSSCQFAFLRLLARVLRPHVSIISIIHPRVSRRRDVVLCPPIAQFASKEPKTTAEIVIHELMKTLWRSALRRISRKNDQNGPPTAFPSLTFKDGRVAGKNPPRTPAIERSAGIDKGIAAVRATPPIGRVTVIMAG